MRKIEQPFRLIYTLSGESPEGLIVEKTFVVSSDLYEFLQHQPHNGQMTEVRYDSDTGTPLTAGVLPLSTGEYYLAEQRLFFASGDQSATIYVKYTAGKNRAFPWLINQLMTSAEKSRFFIGEPDARTIYTDDPHLVIPFNSGISDGVCFNRFYFAAQASLPSGDTTVMLADHTTSGQQTFQWQYTIPNAKHFESYPFEQQMDWRTSGTKDKLFIWFTAVGHANITITVGF